MPKQTKNPLATKRAPAPKTTTVRASVKSTTKVSVRYAELEVSGDEATVAEFLRTFVDLLAPPKT